MKSKREMLKHIVQTKGCYPIKCEECPYNDHCTSDDSLLSNLARIGAVTVLRQNRKKFDPSKVLTGVTADKAKVGMWGYASDSLSELRYYFMNNLFCELIEIKDDSYACRFGTSGTAYALFYPIDDDVEVEE